MPPCRLPGGLASSGLGSPASASHSRHVDGEYFRDWLLQAFLVARRPRSIARSLCPAEPLDAAIMVDRLSRPTGGCGLFRLQSESFLSLLLLAPEAGA